jgi:PEP-CTERM motif
MNRVRSILSAVMLASGLARAGAPAILLFDDYSDNQSSRAALQSLSLGFTSADINNFNVTLNGSSWDLVVVEANDLIPVDIPGLGAPEYGSEDWDALHNYVLTGGKAIISFWDGGADVYQGLDTLGSLGVASFTSVNFNTVAGRTLTPWVVHPIFNGPGGTVGPITSLVENGFVDGSELDATGTALAGWTANATQFKAGIVMANGGNTLYNGIALDRLPTNEAVKLLVNEIAFMTQVPEPSSLVLFGAGALWLLRRRR